MLRAHNYLANPPEDGQVWDFGAGASADDWRPLLGEWKVQGNAYKLKTSAGTWNVTTLPNCNSSLSVIARIKRVDPDFSNWNTGLLVKAKVNAANPNAAGYLVVFAKNGVVRGFKITDLLSGGGQEVCTRSSMPMRVGKFNTMKLVARGTDHKFYLNGELACQIIDSDFPRGALAVVGAFPVGPEADAHKLEIGFFSVQALRDPPPAGAQTTRPALSKGVWLAPGAGRLKGTPAGAH